jgi:hypothetical protein
MGKFRVLSMVYRAILTDLIHKAGYPLKEGATGAVTLIQRRSPPASVRYVPLGDAQCNSEATVCGIVQTGAVIDGTVYIRGVTAKLTATNVG